MAQGGTIILQAGTYQEELWVTKRVTLKAGPSGHVTLSSSSSYKPILTVTAAKVTVQGLTFRYRSIAVRAVNSSKLLLLGNSFKPSTQGETQVGIELAGATEATLQNNEIAGAEDGIALREDSTAEILNNRIVRNRWGISLVDMAQATIHHNVIGENLYAGISLWEGSGATISDNNLVTNVIAAIAVRMKAKVVMKRNHIDRNQGSGVVLRDEASATLRKNRISNNEGCGVEAAPKVEVSGSFNTIDGNKEGSLCPAGFPWPPFFRSSGNE